MKSIIPYFLDRNIASPMFIMYSDRFEITSFGGIPEGQTIDNFFAGKSRPANKELADVFAMLGVSEKTGKGVPLIVRKYGKEIYKITESYIEVNIPFNRIDIMSDERNESPVTTKASIKLSVNQKNILNKIRRNPYITVEELMKDLSLNDSTIKRNIRKLKNQGVIRRIGTNRKGYWEILN